MTKCSNNSFTLRIMQLQLYLLIWFQMAETLTDQLIHLGQNVTINCDLDGKEVYWLLQNLSHPPAVILRTFPSSKPLTSKPFHFDLSFKDKYSVKSERQLFINNVTVNELGVYYCINTDMTKFSNGTRLHIIEPTQITDFTECHNHTVVEYIPQNQTLWQSLTIISGLLNGVLIIGGLFFNIVKIYNRELHSKRTKEHSQQLQDTDLQQPQVLDSEQLQDLTEAQYAEVDFSKLCKRYQPSEVNSTYASLQLPKR